MTGDGRVRDICDARRGLFTQLSSASLYDTHRGSLLVGQCQIAAVCLQEDDECALLSRSPDVEACGIFTSFHGTLLTRHQLERRHQTCDLDDSKVVLLWLPGTKVLSWR
jgi:hypothetical protein